MHVVNDSLSSSEVGLRDAYMSPSPTLSTLSVSLVAAVCALLMFSLIACCCFVCWRARRRHLFMQVAWLREAALQADAEAGVSSRHSAYVRRHSKVIVDTITQSLLAHHSTPGASVATLEAAFVRAQQQERKLHVPAIFDAAVRAKVHARLSTSADAPPHSIVDVCVDAAERGTEAHIAKLADSQDAGDRAKVQSRSLQASMMIAVSHALEAAEAAGAVPPANPLRLHDSTTAIQDINSILEAAAVRMSSQGMSRMQQDVKGDAEARVAVVDELMDALFSSVDDGKTGDKGTAHIDVMELLECTIESCGDMSGDEMPQGSDPPHLRAEVAQNASVPFGHDVERVKSKMPSARRAEVVKARIIPRLTALSALAPLPQAVVTSLLSFAVKTTVRQLTIDTSMGAVVHSSSTKLKLAMASVMTRLRAQQALRTAFGIGLQELGEADILNFCTHGEGRTTVHMAPTRTRPLESLITLHANSEHKQSSVNSTTLASAMKARAAQACQEAKWNVAAPAPLPTFSSCVTAEIVSWLQPRRTITSKRGFSPLPTRRSESHTHAGIQVRVEVGNVSFRRDAAAAKTGASSVSIQQAPLEAVNPLHSARATPSSRPASSERVQTLGLPVRVTSPLTRESSTARLPVAPLRFAAAARLVVTPQHHPLAIPPSFSRSTVAMDTRSQFSSRRIGDAKLKRPASGAASPTNVRARKL